MSIVQEKVTILERKLVDKDIAGNGINHHGGGKTIGNIAYNFPV